MEYEDLPNEEKIVVLLEQLNMVMEANLEASMRNYDATLGVIKVITGNREVMDGLMKQHLEGDYYFPPFSLAGEDDRDDE